MIYRIVQCWVRLALILFCRKIHFSSREILKQRGPLLLALNHPNSFLDAILIASHFKHTVHFLARGDAFRKPLIKKILDALKLIPIYRLTEGREYLALNDATFDRSREILLNGGIVLIFAEGLCVNQWQLRSLKKGAARIAVDAWSQPAIAEIFAVQPVSLNYDSFNHFRKTVLVHFARPIQNTDLPDGISEGEMLKLFNRILSHRLNGGLIESKDKTLIVPFLIRNYQAYPGHPDQLIERLNFKKEYLLMKFGSKTFFPGTQLLAYNNWQTTGSLILSLLIAPFALTGWLLHAPIYYPIRNLVKSKTKETVFYDSVLFGLLMLTYPVCWLLINLFAFLFTDNMYIRLLLLFMPLLAWLFLIWKDKLQSAFHYLFLPEKIKRILGYI